MPIYEYMCGQCGGISAALVMKAEEQSRITCRHCRSASVERILSRFALHKTERQRVAEYTPRHARDDGFYKDDRNIGLWARKRMNQLGVDLGAGFEETVENARSGKLPEAEWI